jgi:hypothetical protein
MAKRDSTRESDFSKKRLMRFSGFPSLVFGVLLFCSCGIIPNGGESTAKQEQVINQPTYKTTYYRPYAAIVQATTTVLKNHHITYTEDPQIEGIIVTDVMGGIEVKRLGANETRVTLINQSSRLHPLQQTFFVELDEVLDVFSQPPPPPTSVVDEYGVETFLPPKRMFISVRGGGPGNIRSSARIGRNIIGKLPTWTLVSAYKRKGEWYHIEFGPDQKGWAHEIILKDGLPDPKTHMEASISKPKRNIKQKKASVKKDPPEKAPPLEDIQSSEKVVEVTTIPQPADQTESNLLYKEQEKGPLKKDPPRELTNVPPEDVPPLENVQSSEKVMEATTFPQPPEQAESNLQYKEQEKSPLKKDPSWGPTNVPPEDVPPLEDIQSSEKVVEATTIPQSPDQTESKLPPEEQAFRQLPLGDIAAPVPPVLQIWKKGLVSVLEEPNVLAPITGTLEPGVKVAQFQDVGSFYRIEHKGLKGYVYKDFCIILD